RLSGPLDQAGTRPHRIRINSRPPSLLSITTGAGCVGAILYRGGKFGVVPLNLNRFLTASAGARKLYRPHIVFVQFARLNSCYIAEINVYGHLAAFWHGS
ncbi:uncharacterized protein METZ01_LOCUS390358, partial [marine metagenome]